MKPYLNSDNSGNRERGENKTNSDKSTSQNSLTNQQEQKKVNNPQSGNGNRKVSDPPLEFGISLKSLEKTKIEEKGKEKLSEKKLKENEKNFTQKQLEEVWLKFSETISDDHHFRNSLYNSMPHKLTDDTFEIIIDNPIQAQKIENVKNEIINFLRKELINDKIKMRVRVDINNERKVAFTSKEKFELMAEQNKNLLLLKEKLNLELL